MNKFEELYELLKSHDWYYMYSDDMRVYRKGRDSMKRIEQMVLNDSELSDLYEAYRADHSIDIKDYVR